MNMETKVDFLGIGAQKSATTWLEVNLSKHPEIWMPPIKELHYFDRLLSFNSKEEVNKKINLNKYKRKLTKKKNRKPILTKAIKRLLKEPSSIFWLYKYFYIEPNDNWYIDLFKQGKNKIVGEITPEYSIIGERKIKYLNKLLPETKIIFLLRNPIHRCWSQIRFYGQDKHSYKLNELKKFIDSPQQDLRSDYIKIINLWAKYIKKEQFFIGFYDDVQNNPEKLFKNILHFLGADQTFIPENLNQKVHVSKNYDFPEEIKYYLAKKYHPQLEELAKMLGGHTIKWLEEAEEILGSN